MRTSGNDADHATQQLSRLVLVALGAVAIVLGFCLPRLIDGDGDVATFLFIGRTSTAYSCLIDDFDNPPTVDHPGHDGQMYYVIARDLPHVRASEHCLDSPRYRLRRILYPLLASPFGEGQSLALAMTLINLSAVAALAVLIAQAGRELGVTPFVGLGIALSSGIIMAVADSLVEPLAYALALGGVMAWRRRQTIGAVVLFALAGLTRETALVAAVACFLDLDRARPRRDRVLLLTSFAIAGAWWLFVQLTVPAGSFASGISLDPPFRTFFVEGLTSSETIVALVMIAASLWAARGLWDRFRPIAIWLALDAFILTCVSPYVADGPLNPTRVVCLAVPMAVLTVAARRQTRGMASANSMQPQTVAS